ncbi:ATP-binding protein [Streptomyces sp. SID14478]|nr:ATP-binding protein [Streptomyces sp. SID14478]NEB74373.1 ATP-binding protein [Streptomyces sp. SID14478]
MARKPWHLAFTAEPEEVPVLRRTVRMHLGLWGLHEAIEAAELCVSELVSNVITHVGPGTPTDLHVSMSGTYVRLEVHDPDSRALPTLLDASTEAENGRGMALVDAITDRWGVQLRDDGKVTWCELATGLASPSGHGGGIRVTRAEAVLGLYGQAALLPGGIRGQGTSVCTAVAKAAAIDVIADLLHWLHRHGYDPDEALDCAQTSFERGAG